MKNTMRWLVVAAFLVMPVLSHADDGAAAYKKAAGAVVAIMCETSDGKTYCGTGVVMAKGEEVIDGRVMKGSLIVTAEHVIRDAATIVVLFPARDSTGAIIGNLAYYRGRGSIGRVVKTSRERDIALLDVIHTDNVDTIDMSANVSTGEQVCTIGAGSGVLWHCASGNVRQVYEGTCKTEFSEVKARLIDMTIPINPGDSGGPVLNQAGEMVGINLATVTASNQVHKALHISEIVAFLEEVLAERRALIEGKK
jgi:serine protease Do